MGNERNRQQEIEPAVRVSSTATTTNRAKNKKKPAERQSDGQRFWPTKKAWTKLKLPNSHHGGYSVGPLVDGGQCG